MKSETAAQSTTIDFLGRLFLIYKIPFKYMQIEVKGMSKIWFFLLRWFYRAFTSQFICSSVQDKIAQFRLIPFQQGRKLFSLQKYIKGWSCQRIASASFDPLSPVEKFQRNLTAFFYIGTEVPPDVSNVTVLCSYFLTNLSTKSLIPLKSFSQVFVSLSQSIKLSQLTFQFLSCLQSEFQIMFLLDNTLIILIIKKVFKDSIQTTWILQFRFTINCHLSLLEIKTQLVKILCQTIIQTENHEDKQIFVFQLSLFEPYFKSCSLTQLSQLTVHTQPLALFQYLFSQIQVNQV